MYEAYTCRLCNLVKPAAQMRRTNKRKPVGECTLCCNERAKNYYLNTVAHTGSKTLQTLTDVDNRIKTLEAKVLDLEKEMQETYTLLEQAYKIKAVKEAEPKVITKEPQQPQQPQDEPKPQEPQIKLLNTLSASGSTQQYPDMSDMFSPEAIAERKRRAELDAQDVDGEFPLL